MSSTSVYEPKHINTKETDFDGIHRKMEWCTRFDYPYEGIKRLAECALWQEYSDKKWIAVRYPFAIGMDDYTKRLRFYVEHTIKEIPMCIDNIDCQMCYIRSDEAEYSINTEAAEGLGFRFSILKDWIYDLLDYYINEVENQELMEEKENKK